MLPPQISDFQPHARFLNEGLAIIVEVQAPTHHKFTKLTSSAFQGHCLTQETSLQTCFPYKVVTNIRLDHNAWTLIGRWSHALRAR